MYIYIYIYQKWQGKNSYVHKWKEKFYRKIPFEEQTEKPAQNSNADFRIQPQTLCQKRTPAQDIC